MKLFETHVCLFFRRKKIFKIYILHVMFSPCMQRTDGFVWSPSGLLDKQLLVIMIKYSLNGSMTGGHYTAPGVNL